MPPYNVHTTILGEWRALLVVTLLALLAEKLHAAPQITLPQATSTLSSNSVTFEWSANGTAGIVAWWLEIGNSPGGTQYLDSGNISANQFNLTVNGLPQDGTDIHVRLWYRGSALSSWLYVDYIYSTTAANNGGNSAGGTPSLLSPAAGAVLGSSDTFTWSANGVSGLRGWWLYIGSTPGASDYRDSGYLSPTTTSLQINSLPQNGSAVHIRLWYLNAANQWLSVDQQYTATSQSNTNSNSGANAGTPAITSPVAGSTLGNSDTFTWSHNGLAGIRAWWLYVGSSAGGNNYLDSGNLSLATNSLTMNSLPSDGSTVHVRLWYLDAGNQWQSVDQQFTATSTSSSNTNTNSATPMLVSPASGSNLGNGDSITWSDGGLTSVQAWWLYVGSSSGASNYLDSGQLPLATTSLTLSTLPIDGSSVYVRLWYLDANNQWQSTDEQYTTTISVAPIPSKPNIITPISGVPLDYVPRTMIWSDNGSGAENWWVSMGSAVGQSNYFDSGNLPASQLQITLPPPPIAATKVFIRLWFQVGGVWKSVDSTHTTPPSGFQASQLNQPGATIGDVAKILENLQVSTTQLNVQQNPIDTQDGYLYIANVELGADGDNVDVGLQTVMRQGKQATNGQWSWDVASIEDRTIYDPWHSPPSVAVGPDGHVHIVYNMHNFPWQYQKSSNPHDIDSMVFKGQGMTLEELVRYKTYNVTDFPTLGSADIPGNQITYPIFYKDKNKDLYLSYRFAARPAREFPDRTMSSGIAKYDATLQTWNAIGAPVGLSANDFAQDAQSSSQSIALAGQIGWTSYSPRLAFGPSNEMHATWFWRPGIAGATLNRPCHIVSSNQIDFFDLSGSTINLPAKPSDCGNVGVSNATDFCTITDSAINSSGQISILLCPFGSQNYLVTYDGVAQQWVSESIPINATDIFYDDDDNLWIVGRGIDIRRKDAGSTSWTRVYSDPAAEHCYPTVALDDAKNVAYIHALACNQQSVAVYGLQLKNI